VFRRRKNDEDALLGDEPSADSAERSDEPADFVDAPTQPAAATAGPWDSDDAPDDGLERVDLGGLRLPVPDGGELRVELDEATQTVQAVLVVHGQSVLQIGAFAAPRSEGIWSEVADEIVSSIRQAGGSAEPAEGPFGREIRAHVPGEDPNGNRVVAPTRFFGVDGPRWFLRGLLQGPAADDPTAAPYFEQVFRHTVVVRGGEAMAPRDPLPLRLPREASGDAGPSEPDASAEPADDGQPDFNPFDRGPEITEIL